jgi:hypothetical protein
MFLLAILSGPPALRLGLAAAEDDVWRGIAHGGPYSWCEFGEGRIGEVNEFLDRIDSRCRGATF